MKREKAVDEKELYLYSILEENRAFFDGMGNGRRLQTEDETETYQQLAAIASDYLLVMGMYEIKKGNTFEPYNRSVNKDSNSWKSYDTHVRTNLFGL